MSTGFGIDNNFLLRGVYGDLCTEPLDVRAELGTEVSTGNGIGWKLVVKLWYGEYCSSLVRGGYDDTDSSGAGAEFGSKVSDGIDIGWELLEKERYGDVYSSGDKGGYDDTYFPGVTYSWCVEGELGSEVSNGIDIGAELLGKE